MKVDLSKETDCEEVMKKTIDHFKQLNVLVANAGILFESPLETMTMEEYDLIMNINCRAVIINLPKKCPRLGEKI